MPRAIESASDMIPERRDYFLIKTLQIIFDRNKLYCYD